MTKRVNENSQISCACDIAYQDQDHAVPLALLSADGNRLHRERVCKLTRVKPEVSTRIGLGD